MTGEWLPNTFLCISAVDFAVLEVTERRQGTVEGRLISRPRLANPLFLHL